jgi:uncharacterized membrane protein
MIFFKQLFAKLQPDQFFFVCATLFGLIFLVLTPPFQAPDEINHFYRAYQIADRHLIAEQRDQRVGGEIPQSLVSLASDFRWLTWTASQGTSASYIWHKFETPLDAGNRQFVDFPNTAMYSPVSYAPQAAVLWYLKPFQLSPLSLFYWTRLATLIFWVFALYFTIQILPVYKWAFTLLAMLPTSVFINMSISADVVTNALAFFSIAYALKLAYEEPVVSRKQFMVLCLLTFLLASVKIVYTPVLLVVLLIPKVKFGTKRQYYSKVVALAAIGLATAVFWSMIMKGLYLPYHQYNPAFRGDASLMDCADMYQQTNNMLSHGFYLVKVFVHSLIESSDRYYRGFIGTFDWQDTYLPSIFIPLAYGVIVLIFLIDGKKEIKVTAAQKGILLAGFFSIVFLVLLTQHLIRDCVGGDLIYSIQGRYFIPAAPLLLFAFYNTKFSYEKWVAPVVTVFTVVAFIVSFVVLYQRYYTEEVVLEVTDVTCDAEQLAEGNLFRSDMVNAFFENGNTQSKEQARSGVHAAKVDVNNAFTFTYRMRDCAAGDFITVEVWRLGTTGRVTIVNDTYHLYAETIESIEKDSKGWEKLVLKYKVPRDLRGDVLTVYLFFNESKTPTYFDDIHITHAKFK